MSLEELIRDYLEKIYRVYQLGSTTEGSFYPYIKTFFENLSRHTGQSFEVIILPARTSAGYPDGKIVADMDIIGHFECKDLSSDLKMLLNTSQVERYVNSFENFILTNYLDFFFFRSGNLKKAVSLAEISDFKEGRLHPRLGTVSEFEKYFLEFCSYRVPRITSANQLAELLARKTVLLKEKLDLLLSENEDFKGIYKAFREHFIRNMSETDFCDTLAQAFVYSLLIARLYVPSSQSFKPQDVLTLIPENLKLIRDFYAILYTDISDEEVKNMIADIAEILNKFDPGLLFTSGLTLDDLITYFYEPFLKEYNPVQREIRGVYFTPSPVVDFIVKSVDKLLIENFNLKDGLGSFGGKVKVLDPAGGTLTFIVHALNRAITGIKSKYGEGAVKSWLENYGTENFFAFELLPAAYVIGHLRVSALLKSYEVNKRFPFYLTNTLELEHKYPLFPVSILKDMSEETRDADKVKKEIPVIVVLGNPPYSGISANMEAELARKIKENWDGCQSYYEVDGKPLGEKKVWLQDDYVKFIRFGQWKIHTAGCGILAYITNHAYLDNPTFRGMRQSLLKTFDRIYILNLHGNARRREPDENVFDIQQGTAIGIFVKDNTKEGECAKVYYADTLEMGIIKRNNKYQFLLKNDVDTINWKEIQPASPYYYFVPVENIEKPVSKGEFKINEIFEEGVSGIVTARDQLVIGFTRGEVVQKITNFLDTNNFTDNDIRRKYKITDNYAWKLKEQRIKAVQEIKKNMLSRNIISILYRPFDLRFIFYHPVLVFRGRQKIMKHFLTGENVGIVTHKREELAVNWAHIFVTKTLVEHGALSSKTTNYVFPLYLYYYDRLNNNTFKKVNFKKSFWNFLKSNYPSLPPEEVFYYIYALLHSECYRTAYKEELMYDFPAIPFFEEDIVKVLIFYGKRLVELHTDWNNKAESVGRFPVLGNNTVEKKRIKFEDGKVWINNSQYFENIPEEVWEYYTGGYQVLKKWLKERDKRQIDPLEFMRIAGAIYETLKIQTEIDEILSFMC